MFNSMSKTNNKENKPDARKRNAFLWVAIAVICDIVFGVFAVYAFGAPASCPFIQPAKPANLSPAWREDKTGSKKSDQFVTALGRIEPFGEVVKLALPGFLHDERIDRIYVRDGDPVKKGQLICSVDNARRLQAKLLIARNNLMRAKARLTQVKAGAKHGEIEAQRHRIATIAAERAEGIEAKKAMLTALTAQCNFAEREYSRFQRLFGDGAISASQLDDKRAAQALARGRVLECRADLRKIEQSLDAQSGAAEAELAVIREVRPVDVDIAEEEVRIAEADLKSIETDLELSYIRSPINGRVLKVYIHPGEAPGSKGLVELGATDRMVSVAEVYQTDVAKVQQGQRAIISGDGFSGTVGGIVYSVGWKVCPQRVASDSPDSPNDRRVVEVKIMVDPGDCRKVSKLTDMEVDVRIETSS